MNWRIKFLICNLLVSLITVKGFSQNTPQFSLYHFNPVSFNPSFAGTSNFLIANFQGRSQWLGIPGHPTIQNFNISSPIPIINGGICLSGNNFNEGAFQQSSITFGGAFHFKRKKSITSIGINGGLMQFVLSGDKLRSPEGNYNVGAINHNDAMLPINTISDFSPDLNLGISFLSEHFYLSSCALHLVPVNFQDNVFEQLNLKQEKEYIFNLGSTIGISKSFLLQPNILVKKDVSSFQSELVINSQISNYAFLGFGYRGFNSNSSDAIICQAGFKAKSGICLMYSYDLPISGISKGSTGSHEILVSYKISLLKTPLPGKIIFTPRY